jgi:hypothetical protein
MAAQQFIIGAYDKLIDLLEAHPAFIDSVKAMTLIDWTSQQRVGRQRALAGGKAPADYAEVELSLSNGEDTAYTLTQHFGMKNAATPAANIVWTERVTQAYLLRITTDAGTTITTPQLLHLEAMTAIRKGNPKLGLTYVQSWGPMSWVFDRFWLDPTMTDPKPRPTTEITIPVTFQFKGTDLLT